MGQANQRGTKEERQRVALLAKQHTPKDVGSPRWHLRMALANRFLVTMRRVAEEKRLDEAVTQPYSALLRYMWELEYRGACHSTSAILFVLMSERGLSPKLCIGEVRANGPYFDHSWIELDSKIFDVAVSLPDLSGAEVGGPVFASIDLAKDAISELEFGITDGEGLGDAARVPFENTLNGYAEAQLREVDAGPNIWERIAYLAPHVGLECTIPNLIEKYGNVMREYQRGGSCGLK